MAFFMPSEIARLVLGYLKEAGCIETTSIYMKENPHLSEYVTCLKQGHEYPTTIGGKTLLDLLNELCSLRTGVQTARNDEKTTEIKESLTRIEKGITELKHFASNGSLARNDCETVTATRIPIQKTTNRILLNMTSETNQEASKKVTSSSNNVEINNSAPVPSNGPQMPSVQIDLPLSSPSEADVPALMTPTSVSSMSTLCSSRSLLSTPTSRLPTINSSPSSIARSAIVFSFGIDALKTPMKDKNLAEDGSWKSPRRKGQLPRKRLYYSPLPTAKKKCPDKIESVSPEKNELQKSNDDVVDFSVFVDQLVNDTALHERLAKNINRVVSNSKSFECTGSNNLLQNETTEDNRVALKSSETPTKSCDSRVTSPISEICLPDNVVEDLINQSDLVPLYEAFITSCLEKNENFDETMETDSLGTPQSQILGTPTSVRSYTATDSSPCCVSESINQNFASDIAEINESTPLASVISSRRPSSAVNSDHTRVSGISPYKTLKPVSETKSCSVIGNSPKRTDFTTSPRHFRQISDVFHRKSDIWFKSDVATAQPPTTEEISLIPETTVTYTVLEPVAIGTVIDLSSPNKTTVLVQDLQLQNSGSIIQTLNPLPTQSDVQIVTHHSEQPAPVVGSSVENNRTVGAFIEQKEQKKVRTVRPNQRCSSLFLLTAWEMLRRVTKCKNPDYSAFQKEYKSYIRTERS